jgi:hypothetical protein
VPGAALVAAGWTPATIGLLAGALTWLAVAGRAELRGRGDGLPEDRLLEMHGDHEGHQPLASTRKIRALLSLGGEGNAKTVDVY